MKRFTLSVLLASWLTSPWWTDPVQAHEGPHVHPGTASHQTLGAPRDGEAFDFMIFGDRTGGPAEGIEVLADAVRMANRLDVDLVMTVGDLVEGYNQPEEWLAQMKEYKSVVDGLNMFWYPVAGNHDVYARPVTPDGNMGLYKQHFGPLYYSFDFKWAHFIVLFSDENLAFGDPPEDQNFSPEQMAWLRDDIRSTKASALFVFLHHPRWTKRYAGCNWDDVHRLFAEAGRPVTMFAGHIHIYRDDGERDNVHYYALATTGGWKSKFTETASLHHVDFVRVRPDRVTVAVLPVGSVLSGDFVLGEEVDMMYELDRGDWISLHGRAAIGLESPEHSTFAVTLQSPANRDLPVTVTVSGPTGWQFTPQQLSMELPPGDALSMPIQVFAPTLAESAPDINVRVSTNYALASGLVQPIHVTRNVPIELVGAEPLAGALPDNNGVLVLDGSSAVRVEIPEGLEQFTLECWGQGGKPASRAALVTKTENSSYGIFWLDDQGGTGRPTAYVGTTQGYLTLPVGDTWEWGRWSHLALVFDGRRARFYVNGKLHAEQTTDASLTHNRFPLYIGADPDSRGQPSSFFTGAIDEVRLSRVARYAHALDEQAAHFDPVPVFQRDNDTVLLLHFDRSICPPLDEAGQGGLSLVFPDDSGTGHHGWAVGQPRIEPMAR